MDILQMRGLVRKNIVNYVKSYQIVYDLVCITLSAIFVLAMTYLK
jgi:hypothetical protein